MNLSRLFFLIFTFLFDMTVLPAANSSKILLHVNFTQKPTHRIAFNRFLNQWIIAIKMVSFIVISNRRIYCWQANWKVPLLNWPILVWPLKLWAINRHGLVLPVHQAICHQRCLRKSHMDVPLIFGLVVSFYIYYLSVIHHFGTKISIDCIRKSKLAPTT